MKIKVVVEVSADEMNDIRQYYGESWTNEQIMFERIMENGDSYLQNIEVKVF